jgi:hypothetical protein
MGREAVKSGLQLSLFPQRGFGLLLYPGQLAVDLETMLPVVRATRRSLRRVTLPQWLRDYATVVEVRVHEDLTTGRPTYVIGKP